MNLLRALTSATLFTSMLFVAHSRAEACAAGPVSFDGSIGADAQRVFIALGASKTEIVVEVTVPITNQDYGILIPVPARPVLDPLPVEPEELDALERATAPTIIDSGSSSGGIGCGSAAAGLNDRGGNVIQTVEIGPLTVVALTASSADDLNAWLADNNFNIPAGKADVLTRYARDGSYFIAARRNNRVANNVPTRIGLHFTLPGEQLALGLPTSQLGGSEAVSYVVFVVGPDKVGPLAPYATLTLSDLDRGTLQGSYRAALEGAVAKKTGRAFIVEAVIEDPAQGLLTGRLAALAGSNKYLTRLSTVSTPSSLTDDLLIGASGAPASVPSMVDLGAEPEDEGGCQSSSGRVTPLLYLLMFAGYWQLRRRSLRG